MNLIKWFCCFLGLISPLILLWGEFFVGHLLNFEIGVEKWWGFPYLFTCFSLFAGSVLLTSYIIAKFEWLE